ncbi:hypothetical protein CW309_12580 [Pseudomonas hunanensis]|uniref:Uncharacterized protein n=1 Tax=Pseudomonas hunanensis TaxID=1247546 RepID=A0ACC9N0Q7_9PSED|nr:hypothetical protein CW309_12580 [Pseudomonas hunanensis]
MPARDARTPCWDATIWRPCSTFERPTRSPVGAGLPAKGPGLPANLHPPFTIAATTVFAGKPAPTTGVDSWIQARRRSGFTRERAGPAGQSPPAVHRCRRYRIRG